MCNPVMRQKPAGRTALQRGLQPVELLKSHKRQKKGFRRTQPVPFGKCFLHSLRAQSLYLAQFRMLSQGQDYKTENDRTSQPNWYFLRFV